MKALLLFVLLGQSPGQLPASKTKVVVTESPSSRTVEVGDFANKAVRVNCVTGCSGSGSGGGSGDGKILDGTATGQADVIGSAPAGTEQGLVTRNIPSGTQPVSGTFWQATQPVSGTFWQATQPISGSVTATGPLTDTQLRATPVPVSGTLTATVSGVALDATLTGGTQKTKLVDTAGTNVATVSATGALKMDGSAVTQPVSGTFWQATQPVSGTFWQATQPVSAASLPLPSGAATSAKQPALGTAGTPSADVLTVQGVTSMTALKVDGSAVTQPVSGPVTDTQLRATALPVSGTFWPATQPVSGTVTANAGTGTMAVSGTFWQATQPVSGPLTDTQLRATALPVSGTFWQATQPVSGTFFQATQPVSGTVTANAGTGTMAVSGPLTDTQIRATALPVSGTVTANIGTAGTLALDATLTGGTAKARVSGNAGAAFDAANNAAMPANALSVGVQTATIDTSPTAATAGNLRYQLASTEGVTYVQEGGPKRFSCLVTAVTVMTQCQAAPAAGLRAYVTSFTASNQAATVQTLDVVYGTGSNCATAPTALTHKVQFGTNATTTSPQSYGMQFQTPLVPVAANAICVRPSAATAFGATLTGYVAP
jgi:hypothetical protein